MMYCRWNPVVFPWWRVVSISPHSSSLRIAWLTPFLWKRTRRTNRRGGSIPDHSMYWWVISTHTKNYCSAIFRRLSIFLFILNPLGHRWIRRGRPKQLSKNPPSFFVLFAFPTWSNLSFTEVESTEIIYTRHMIGEGVNHVSLSEIGTIIGTAGQISIEDLPFSSMIVRPTTDLVLTFFSKIRMKW